MTDETHCMPMTAEDAAFQLKHMRAARPDCSACDTMSFHAVYLGVANAHGGTPPAGAAQARVQELFDEGWAPLTDRAGVVKRCSACENTPKYPWAEKLDPEQVAKWVNDKRAANGDNGVVDLLGLKELVEP